MPATATLKTLTFEQALAALDAGAAFIDLRGIDEYLEVHVPGSIALGYEAGPGMPSRARDCIPLDVPLVILDLGAGDALHAAASLRGKGFRVLGKVDDAVNRWVAHGGRAQSTEVLTGPSPPPGLVLDVADPGASAPEGSLRIAAEHLWARAEEAAAHDRVIVAAGRGVRAALAVGILERAGAPEVFFWRTAAGRRVP